MNRPMRSARVRGAIARGLRAARLLGAADAVVARLDRIRTHSMRRSFRTNNPQFELPPPLLAYDAFGSSEPMGYYVSGQIHAQYIADIIKIYHETPRVICDWGCGPMRVLRHIPTHFPDARLIGLDYNPRTVDWAKRAFPEIRFILNNSEPPLPLADGAVDVLYGISVFTHLSEQHHYGFVTELRRCLAPGGILIVTLHGDRYAQKMTASERLRYDRGELVTRERTPEGKRMYAAFHSPAFAARLFSDFRILAHDTADRVPRFWQDTWVMRRMDDN